MKRLVNEAGQGRAWLGPVLLFALLCTYLFSSQASAETGSHHQAYLDALDTVIAAEARIGGEMARISSAAVAHYDFLQHEHIELLRHASALRHPPTALSARGRESVLDQADALRAAAESLELVIADFLRAEALLASAVSNTLDLLATKPEQSLTDAELGSLQQLAQAVGDFRGDNTAATRELLDAAFDKVESLGIAQTWQGELSAQRTLIRNNSAEAAGGLDKLARVGVTSLAVGLRGAYIAAMGQ